MAKFIILQKLNGAATYLPMRVNVNQITHYTESGKTGQGAYILLSAQNLGYHVKETPDQIDGLIRCANEGIPFPNVDDDVAPPNKTYVRDL